MNSPSLDVVHDQLFAWIHGYYVKLHYLPHNYPIIMFKILY